MTTQPGGLSRELTDQLDFSFFRSVYNSYNTIWQHVLKLPIYGENHVKHDEFIRVLKSCGVFGSSPEDNNVFCNFLLFSCTNHLKQTGIENSRRSTILLLDFRLFLKSVFMTLKRQFTTSGQNQEKSIGSGNNEAA